MIGLGLALAQPDARVAVITGDGEMLMGMGALATIGVQRPHNLAVIVFDNGLYGETGMQASHTQSGVDLVGVARACGIGDVLRRARRGGPGAISPAGSRPRTRRCSRACGSRPTSRRACCRERDGVALKQRFRAALGAQALNCGGRRGVLDSAEAGLYNARASAARPFRAGFGAQVAQLVEHAIENRSVGGSIPPLGTTSRSQMFADVRNTRKNNLIALDLIVLVRP